jgi:hypothetical protein
VSTALCWLCVQAFNFKKVGFSVAGIPALSIRFNSYAGAFVPGAVVGIRVKTGVVHSLWCATKVNFVASSSVFLPSQFSGIGFATAPQLRAVKSRCVAT